MNSSIQNNFEWEKYIIECLESTDYCSMATVDSKGVWSNPLYFAWDENFNLYFISQPNSRHMQNIEKDPRVSAAIYSTAQDTFGDVVGVQLSGKARILSLKDEIATAKNIYYGRRYWSRGMQIPDNGEDQYINNPKWQFVIIEPDEIFYFDTRFFDEERQRVPEEIFSHK